MREWIRGGIESEERKSDRVDGTRDKRRRVQYLACWSYDHALMKDFCTKGECLPEYSPRRKWLMIDVMNREEGVKNAIEIK